MAGDAAAPRACLEAAQGLISRYRQEQALLLIDHGLALAQAPADICALHLLRGEALLAAGNAADAGGAYATALAIAAAPRDECHAWLGLASARRLTDDLDRAMEDVEKAITIAEGEGMIEEAARGYSLRGNLRFPRGDIEGCCADHERSLELARVADSAELHATALGGLGDAEYIRGRLGTAHARYSECVTMSAAHDLRRVEAANLPMQAITQFWKGDMRRTRELAVLAIDAATQIGHERAEMVAHHAAYFAYRHLSLLDEAYDHASLALDIARHLKAPRFEAEGLAFQAQIAIDRGAIDEARALLGEALAIGRSSGMGYLGPILLAGRARTATTNAERDDAVAEAEQLLAAGSASHNHLMFRRDAIDVFLACRDWDGVRRHADALEDYASIEPSAFSRFLVARARALAFHGEGSKDVGIELARLAAEAEKLGDLVALVAIAEAVPID